MQNRPDFTRKPFHGVFREAAVRLRVKGANARNVVANRYRRGEHRAVAVVDALIHERMTEFNRHRETLQQAAQLQREAV